jgi:hypothetical protein
MAKFRLRIIGHYPAITETDRRKLYTSLYVSPKTPLELQNKVQFDIRFYFCRRGNENMPQMRKSTCMYNVRDATDVCPVMAMI